MRWLVATTTYICNGGLRIGAGQPGYRDDRFNYEITQGRLPIAEFAYGEGKCLLEVRPINSMKLKASDRDPI